MTHSQKHHIARAQQSLHGLSIGDAFGETFFTIAYPPDAYTIIEWVQKRRTMPAPWTYTDDTQMAISIVAILQQYGTINQDALAADFAVRYDPRRGYGAAMHDLLRAINNGEAWQIRAANQFGGKGSYGNGAAMRIAPLGAFFANDLEEASRQARLSAEVTHTHPEAIAGAIAVAIAAAQACTIAGTGNLPTRREFIDMILPWIPESEVRTRTVQARDLSEEIAVEEVAQQLGSGYMVSAQDTVPFVLWCTGGSLDNYEEALWLTVQGLGDIDTTCAMVGGIVSLCCPPESIPLNWQEAREPLPVLK